MTEDKGVFGKYIIGKADGSDLEPEACYFVLRLDTDPAARRAMGQYARSVRRENETLANDIEKCVSELERPQCGCREAMCQHTSMFSDVWRAGS